MKSCGAEKRSFTVKLAVAADGKKLIDCCILSFVIGVKEWIRTRMPRNPTGERSLLVWDSFRAHLTESVKEALQQRSIDVAVIPGGLTPVLQPLDKCLNVPFKENMRRKYLSWMVTGPFKFTPAGKKKAPSRNLVLRWIKQSWREIPEEMVRKSFLPCGISNALDGTEDDVIYEEEQDDDAKEDEMDEEFDTESEDEP